MGMKKKPAKKPARPLMPEEIFVQWSGCEDPFLEAHENAEHALDVAPEGNRNIWVYRLVSPVRINRVVRFEVEVRD